MKWLEIAVVAGLHAARLVLACRSVLLGLQVGALRYSDAACLCDA